MRKMRKLLFVSFYFYCSSLLGQENFTGLNDSVINLGCTQTCATLHFRVPHLKSSEEYAVAQIPYKPYSYTSPAGNGLPASFYDDDVFSGVINLPFSICFYEQVYNQIVMGSNGVLTFDISNAISAACPQAAYLIDPPIPYANGIQCDRFSIYYPRASIMGVFSDLNAVAGSSPVDRKIEWRIEGTAPFRKLIASWYHIGVYGTNCGLSQPTSFQIVVNEATSVIEVFIEQKICNDNSSASNGLAILGIQNWDRDKAVTAPGKNATLWTAEKEGYRFVPSGATSRFLRADLLDMTGNVLETATTAETIPGFMDINFSNICPANASEKYVIRTIYSGSCASPNTDVIIKDTITINKSVLPVNTISTQTDCGVGTGTIKAFIPAGSGSTGPYTFLLNPDGISQTVPDTARFNGLAEGSYTITATDNGGCTNTVSVNITGTGTFHYDYIVNPPSCLGASNGSISFNLPTGMGPVQYFLAGSPRTAIGNTISNLGAGFYPISIEAGPSCKAIAAIAIPDGVGTLSGTATSTATSCFGANDGSITVMPATGSYEYSINSTTVWQPGNIFTGLSPGTYNVRLRKDGCTSPPIEAVVTEGAGLTVTATATDATCAGVNNGSISVTTNGTAPFTFAMDGSTIQPGVATNTTIFNNVTIGTHTITVTDASDCTTVTPVTVTVNAGAGFTAAFISIPTSCLGGSSGSISINPAGGASPYTFILNPGGRSQTGSNTTFNALTADTYTALITDASGCQLILSDMVVTSGPGLNGDLVSTPTTCAGVNNGTITVTPLSGNAPFSMVLDGSTTQAGNPGTIFTNVSAGSHSVTFTDANGCITAMPLTTIVDEGTGYSADFTTTGTSCIGLNNGSITITPQLPGTAPFRFVLNPGNHIQNGPTAIFNGLSPGNYNVLITDANGCQASINDMNVAQGVGLLAGITLEQVTCFGAHDGSIMVSPTNGAGPYTFLLNGATPQTGASNTTFAGLGPGTYTISITDATGCMSAPISHTIIEPALLSIPAPTVQAVSCNGANDGIITVNPAGGAVPYMYSLDNTNFKSQNTFIVSRGTYTVYVKDANGCESQATNVVVLEPPALNATIVSTMNATCGGGSDAVIEVAATGGVAPYMYSFNGTDFQISNQLRTTPGTYDVTVRDANGCTRLIQGVTVGLTDNLTLSVTEPTPICEGSGVQLHVTSNATDYSWSSGSSLSDPGIAEPIASPSSTTIYTLLATWGNCARTANVTVTVLPAPIPDAGLNGNICFGQDYQLQGSGGVTYNWSPSTYLDNPGIASPTAIKPTQTTVYTLSVTDANNCSSLGSDNVTVNITPPIKVAVSPTDTVVHAASVFQVKASSEASLYTWSPAIGLNNPSIPDPTVAGLTEGQVITYHVVATTAAGCEGSADITIRVYKGPEIYVATAFTPNNDGNNEVFLPVPVGIRELKYFSVFNRWGQLLFSTNTLNRGWDGRANGAEQPSGVYVWMIEGVTQTGEIIRKNGTVTLIR